MLQIKCRSCQTWNNDRDYCINCNSVISIQEEERIENAKKKEIERNKPKDKIDLFVEKYKNHSNIFIKGTFYMFYSVYLIFAGIGAFFAWLTLMA